MIEPVNVPIILDLELSQVEYDLSVEEAEEYAAQIGSLITISEVYGGLPSGGNTGEILIKNSDEDYDAIWGIVKNGANIWWTNHLITQGDTAIYTAKRHVVGRTDMQPEIHDFLVGQDVEAAESTTPNTLYEIIGINQLVYSLKRIGNIGENDYNRLLNKPQINGIEINKNSTSTSLGLATTSALEEKYTKPVSGIPKSDLEVAVQSSLDKADTALQEHQDISGKLDKTGGTMSGDINMSQNWIKNIHAGTAPYDAVNLKQVQTIVTENAATYRGSFQTKQALEAVPWQSSDPEGQYYVDANDFAIVQADESNNNECWRYMYTAGTGWEEQYKINDTPLSQAQIDALNSGITTVKVQKLDTIQPSAEVNIIEEIRIKDLVTRQWAALPVINKGVNLPEIEIPEEIYYIDFIVTENGDDVIVTSSDSPLYIITQIEGGRIVIGRINYDGIFYALVTEAVEQPLNIRFTCQTNDDTFLNIQNEEEYGWTVSFFTAASEEIVGAAVDSLLEAINTKYSKPSNGIPASDLADNVHLIPSGGTIGQVLRKISNDDWDINWDTVNDGEDGSGVWYTTERISGSENPFVRRRDLIGREGATVQVHDLLFAPDVGDEGEPTTLYEITSVGTACALNRLCKMQGGGGGSVTVDSALSDSSENPVQNKIIKAALDEKGTYSKPSSGIPATDLASDVQNSLGKADTALQPGDVSEPFFVTYSTSDMTTWTCDKTFAQIVTAVAAGKQIVMIGSVGGTPIAQSGDTMLADYGTRLDFWIRYGRNGWYHIIHNDDNSIEFYDAAIGSEIVGAIPAPSYPSSGQYLQYDGDSWEAVSLPAIPSQPSDIGAYALPSGGIPKTDLTIAIQSSLDKADSALQSAPVTSVNGQTGAVTLSIPGGADEIDWTGGNLGQITSPVDVEHAVEAVYNAIPSTASDVGAVAVAQGVAHAGEFVVVGSDGNITTVTMSVWQGGDY